MRLVASMHASRAGRGKRNHCPFIRLQVPRSQGSLCEGIEKCELDSYIVGYFGGTIGRGSSVARKWLMVRTEQLQLQLMKLCTAAAT